jgi:serine/threonine protein kinase
MKLLKRCNQKADVWSFATAIYFAFTGEPLFDNESDFVHHKGSISNHLYLIEKRLGKLPEQIAKSCSRKGFNEFFKINPTTKKIKLKNEFRYLNPEGNPRNPFTIEPFSEESDEIIFPQYLQSFGFKKINGKWKKNEKDSDTWIPITGGKYSDSYKAWQKLEENRFKCFEQRVREVAQSKCGEKSSEEQQKIMLYADVLVDFLRLALELDPNKRATSDELLDTKLMKLARKLRGEMPTHQEEDRAAQAMRAARTLFSMKV